MITDNFNKLVEAARAVLVESNNTEKEDIKLIKESKNIIDSKRISKTEILYFGMNSDNTFFVERVRNGKSISYAQFQNKASAEAVYDSEVQ